MVFKKITKLFQLIMYLTFNKNFSVLRTSIMEKLKKETVKLAVEQKKHNQNLMLGIIRIHN